MAIKTREELMQTANSLFGDNSEDSVLGFLGDLSDTLQGADGANSRIAELEREKTQLDNDWRKKYRERFFAPVEKDDEPEYDNPPALKTKYEQLFEVKKG